MLALGVYSLLLVKVSDSILSQPASRLPVLSEKSGQLVIVLWLARIFLSLDRGENGCMSIIIENAPITKPREANPSQLASPPLLSSSRTWKLRYLIRIVGHTKFTATPGYSYIPPVIGAGKMIFGFCLYPKILWEFGTSIQ